MTNTPPTSPTKKFAVFDIDGTIGRNAIFLQTVDELIANGHLPPQARAQLDQKLEAYRQRKHANAFPEYQKKSVEILFTYMKGLPVAAYRQAADKVLARTKSYTYVYTRDLIRELKQKGYFLIVLSGSEMYAVQTFCQHYGFDIAIGDAYEEQDGILTGKVNEVYGNKDKFLKRLIAEHQLTYKDSIGIGDSGGDIEMLELVERPIAFNPEQRLFAWAQEHNAPIVIERKNIIYELESKHGQYVLAKTNAG